MPKIFISYRRDDSQETTDRIHDHMAAHFGEDSVFQDVDSIPLGADFRQHLSNEINQCDVVLVIIGPEWTRHMLERAPEPNDFVRIEVESALKMNKLVIPVLVRGARMPTPDNLPESLQALCWLNAAKVRPNPDFKRDSQLLAEGIQKGIEGKVSSTPPASAQSLPARKPVNPTHRPNLATGLAKALDRKRARDKVLDLLPVPFEWVFIPGGKVFLEAGGYVPDGGADFIVEDLYIAKYPITSAQYQVFVEANDGWSNPRWWDYSDHAKLWRGGQKEPYPLFAGDAPDHPRANVTWYEAVAFCHWLTTRTDEIISLPTEQQWQRAATGDTGWIYPWGSAWNAQCCNHSVGRKSNGTTPVKQYEGKGDSPFNVIDMAGNVWEWCLTNHRTGVDDLNGEDVRVLRGGSWGFVDTSFFRTTSRVRLHPHFLSNDRGFRIVRA